jgi:fatty-acid desaturase
MSDEPLIAGPESTVTHALLRREPDHVRRIDWSYAGGIALLHLLALLAFVPWLFSWTGVLLVPIGMYTFGTLGINVGLHRLLTHRSLACPRWLERTLVLLGTCGWMDSPAYWVAVHRRHHQFADEEHDPHSPIESFFWSHLGWYMVKIDPERRAELVQR